ncbi:SDR family NAD(P)-dependent oxidoreductase [Smaragdicoccus niigatensis]|uniref:SDR family NAD(P)-dependent oxidoreductase n=1 Tax=Smaragdicoccus niigatensis TaxID=359359 RepID=UPI000381595D|nr:SDR family NAD(P)-dependent oxidoreductase [Smaragdicoccus niigatensis]
MSKKDLTGRVVAITGGARGIGAATARAFVERGASVCIGDIDAVGAVALAKSIGDAAHGVRLDVTDSASFAAFLAAAESHFGGLDVLINNAGIMPTGDFVSQAPTESDAVVDINLRGVIIGSRLAGQRFAEQRNGHIVNVASIAGLTACPGAAVYSATKFAVVGLGQALAQELEPQGITVTTIAPGFVNTELIAGLAPSWFVRHFGFVEPENISQAIVGAVTSGDSGLRVVPRLAGTFALALHPAPERLQWLAARIMGLDTVMRHSDSAARAKYDARIHNVL